jgi:hypothetical protein
VKLHLRIISLFLALTIVLSTGGIAISKHLCNGEVKDVAVFHKADPCHHNEAVQLVKCPVHENMIIQSDRNSENCCSETSAYLNDDEPKNTKTSTELSITAEFVILYTFFHYIFNNYILDEQPDNTISEIPPLLNQDLYILVNIFRL